MTPAPRRVCRAPRRPLATVLAALCSLTALGCIRQQLIIKSDPPGAEIFLNDKREGRTPYDKPFLWYGSYRVTLGKDGYQRLDDHVTLRSPWYLWIPLDLVVELLPFPVRDTKVLSYQLKPKGAIEEPQPPGAAHPSHDRHDGAGKRKVTYGQDG